MGKCLLDTSKHGPGRLPPVIRDRDPADFSFVGIEHNVQTV